MKSSSDLAAGYRGEAAGYRLDMEPEAEPTAPEDLVGKDELDEDDEMELSADDLVDD